MQKENSKRFNINGEHYRIKGQINKQISPDSGTPLILYGGDDRPLLFGQLRVTNNSANIYKFHIGLRLDSASGNNVMTVYVPEHANFVIDRMLFDNLMLETFDVTKCKITFKGVELERNFDVIPA